MEFALFISFASLFFLSNGEIIDYCAKEYDCTSSKGVVDKHTVCLSQCKPKDPRSELRYPDFNFRNRTLFYHNYYREQVASGTDTRGGNSAASNMMVMSYDMKLEFIAACWIHHIGTMTHDDCKTTKRWRRVGQNLCADNIPNTKGNDTAVSEAQMKFYIFRWYDEITLCNAKVIDEFYDTGHAETDGTGHLTQLLWHWTTHVGCALANSTHFPERLGIQFACNYAPAGNYLRKQVYKRGKPASECPDGTKPNKQFPSLCGEIEPWEEDADYYGYPEMDDRWGVPRPPKKGGGGSGSGSGSGNGKGKKKSVAVKVHPHLYLDLLIILFLLLA